MSETPSARRPSSPLSDEISTDENSRYRVGEPCPATCCTSGYHLLDGPCPEVAS